MSADIDYEKWTQRPESVASRIDLIRRLRDVGTFATEHLYHGRCPDMIDERVDRDPKCRACAVLVEADALLGGTEPA